MNNITPIHGTSVAMSYTGKQLELTRRTVAADCTPQEFDLFIEVAKQLQLSPIRKQIYAVVYNKDKPAKRKMSIITGIDGFRAVAARNRDYRPADEEATIVYDETLKSDKNPLGIVKAVVKCWKLGPDREWYPVVGEAYWDEFAPIKLCNPDSDFEYVGTGEFYEDSGREKKRRQLKEGREARYEPDGKWKTMPRVMLPKCAEAQALRRGWPEDLSGVYAPEEMDQARMAEILDTTASEVADRFIADKKLEAMGGKHAYTIQWAPTSPLEQIPEGAFMDRCLAFVQACKTVNDLTGWKETNTSTLQRFWAEHKSDALALKAAMEARAEALSAAPKTDVAA